MESNAEDKAMRDKLKGLEFPFEPAAWDKMEAMLEKDEKKRRGFFWWWFSGAALVTLLASGVGYYFVQQNNAGEQLLADKNKANETTSTISTAQQNTNANPKPIVETITPVEEKINNEISKSSNVATASNVVSDKQTSAVKKANNIVKTKNQKPAQTTSKTQAIAAVTEVQTMATVIEQNNSNPAQTPETEFTGVGQGELTGNSPALPIPHSIPVANVTEGANNETSVAEVVPVETSAKAEALTEANTTPAAITENIQIPTEPVVEEPKVEEVAAIADSTTEEKAQPEPDQQKVKKKMAFNYAFGAMGGVSASLVRSTPDKKMRDGIYKKPSFNIGFVHEFILAKRVGLVSGVMYGVTSYDVDSPKVVSLANKPAYYSSTVREVQIPVGIKVYPVVKDHFRLFINAGIINHVKIKETFSYVAPPIDTTPTIPTATVTNTFYPNQTDFNGTGFGENLTYDVQGAITGGVNTTSSKVNTQDLAINSVSRYYTSFYTSIGVDFVIKKHLVLSAEPTFFMLLQKIGVQDKRKYNFGLNVGMKYMFGK